MTAELDFTTAELWNKPVRGRTFSVAVTGDFSPKAPAAAELLKQGGAAGVLEPLAKALGRATFRLLQFETVLTEADTPIDKSGPNLKSPHEAADFAVAGKFDAALLANNHTGDFGEAALLETIAELKKRKIAVVGAGRDPKDAAKTLFLERGGFCLAVINACEHEFGWAWGDHAGSNAIDLDDIRKKIASAKRRADAVLVVLHGGNETNPLPSPGMTRRLRGIADMGADAVMNIHTHCPQGVEIYRGVPIVYSPGNFYFPYPNVKSEMWYSGYVPEFVFSRRGACGLKLTPYVADLNGVRPLTGPRLRKFLGYLKELSAPIADASEIAAYFEAWATLMGPAIGGNRHTPEKIEPEKLDRETRRALLPFRNLFSCEAHNELMTVFFRQVERALPPDMKRIKAIKAWQERTF